MRAIIRDTEGKLTLRLKMLGCRFSESTGYADSTENRLRLKNKYQQIQKELHQGTFDYMLHFPHSRNVSMFNALQSRFISPGWRGLPTFESFYNHQFDRARYKLPSKLIYLTMGCIGKEKVDEILGFHLMKLIEVLRTVLNISQRDRRDTIAMVIDVLDCAALTYVFPRPFQFKPDFSALSGFPLTHGDMLSIAHHFPVKYREYFLLQYYLGISASELLTLKWADYDLQASLFRVAGREINVVPYARRLLFVQMKKTGNYQHVFTDTQGKRLRINLAWLYKECWPKACAHAGFPGIGASALRRGSVVYLFESGLSVNQICSQTGMFYRPAIHRILTQHLLNPQE
ncbi:Arm DNA-binding domain-containing protein [Rheinheimera metallidurans]|uniref:Arm DNA-binding domain-containing protein n=1 Tax=Rheinheimera metallidurans TaxID=2925781 RepID=UPI003001DA93